MKQLKQEIYRLVGLEDGQDDFSFFEPGGNDHLFHLFFKRYPIEFEELDDWDINHLVSSSIGDQLGIEFELDDSGYFASALNKDKKGIDRILLDFRDPLFVICYQYGELKRLQKLSQKLLQTEELAETYLPSSLMNELANEFGQVNRIASHFEQPASVFQAPRTHKLDFQGDKAPIVMELFTEQLPAQCNLLQIGGYSPDGAQTKVLLDQQGWIHFQAGRFNMILDLFEKLYILLSARWSEIYGRNQITVQWLKKNSIYSASGEPIEWHFAHPIDRIEALTRLLTQANPQIKCIGNSERYSRKLWRVYLRDLEEGIPLKMELTPNFARIWFEETRSNIVLDRVERYFREHISASL